MPDESTISEKAPISPEATFLAEVQQRSGETVSRCYQCRKCTNGCPLVFAMDVMPNQVMRMIQMGMRDELLRSTTIWLCASCQTCTARCPNDIDIAHVMDALRQMSREAGVAAEQKIVRFHEAVLDSIRRYGRMFELGMVGHYKLATLDLFGGAKIGIEMVKKGKLKFLPGGIRAKREVREMFERDQGE
ncbi:MAG: 4Fe-4S dicluster domain-containing protein [Pirellulales bacterium]|nr:4Fe-4S dicluster domain-containing protein [Pirellulales bacterium]